MRLVEMQPRRRDFIQWNLEACQVATKVFEATGDEHAALRYATQRLDGACDLFYGEPLRELHHQFLRSAAEELYRLAVAHGDMESLERVRTRMRAAVELGRDAHVGEDILAVLVETTQSVERPAPQLDPDGVEVLQAGD
jgi:hypothetical protein